MTAASKKRVTVILFLINFSVTFAFGVNDSLFSLYLNGLNASGLIIGLAFTLYSMSKIIISPFAGRMLDRFGAYSVIKSGLTIYLIISYGLIVINNPLHILCLRILQGAACAFFRPVMHYVLGINTGNSKVGKTFGMFDLSFYLALTAAPLLSGGIKEHFSFSNIFMLSFICSCIAFMLVMLIKKDLSSVMPSRSGADLKSSKPAKQLKGIYAYIFMKGWTITSVAILLPLYMKNIGIRESLIGLVLSISSMAMALTLPVSGYYSDKKIKEFQVFFSGLLYYVCLAALFFVSDTWMLIVFSISCGFASGISQPACSALLIRSSESIFLGSVIGRFNFMMGLGSVCGGLACSFYSVMQNGIQVVIWTTCILSTVSVFIFIYYSAEEIIEIYR